MSLIDFLLVTLARNRLYLLFLAAVRSEWLLKMTPDMTPYMNPNVFPFPQTLEMKSVIPPSLFCCWPDLTLNLVLVGRYYDSLG